MRDQAKPMHGHKHAVDPGKRQPKMNLAERFVQSPPKHFRKPEKQCPKNRECRRHAHHQMEMPGHEIVAHHGSSQIVTRQENSRESARMDQGAATRLR
jgi:hypothetical protein